MLKQVNESVTKVDFLVTAVSWEDRFLLGLKRLLTQFAPARVLLVQYEEWKDWTGDAAEVATELCHDVAAQPIPMELSYGAPWRGWYRLRADFVDVAPATALVDISTMPRELIWSAFGFLDSVQARVSFVYHRPLSYSSDWLSRDPQRPRFPYQLSGETDLAKPTALLVTTGFDPARTEQLVRTFEPRLMLFAIQSGSQFNNVEQNKAAHKQLAGDINSKFQGRAEVRTFDIDAYTGDWGYAALARELEPLWGNSNVLMASLGPKLSAVALYRIHRGHREAALVYAPSREFNKQYSLGLGETLMGLV